MPATVFYSTLVIPVTAVLAAIKSLQSRLKPLLRKYLLNCCQPLIPPNLMSLIK